MRNKIKVMDKKMAKCIDRKLIREVHIVIRDIEKENKEYRMNEE